MLAMTHTHKTTYSLRFERMRCFYGVHCLKLAFFANPSGATLHPTKRFGSTCSPPELAPAPCCWARPCKIYCTDRVACSHELVLSTSRARQRLDLCANHSHTFRTKTLFQHARETVLREVSATRAEELSRQVVGFAAIRCGVFGASHLEPPKSADVWARPLLMIERATSTCHEKCHKGI